MAIASCPLCGGRVERMRRTRADRLISRVVLVLRYGCVDAECAWRGRLRPDDPYARPSEVRPMLWAVASIGVMVGLSIAVGGLR